MSTAYYALFHELCTQCVEHTFPGEAPDDVKRRNSAARWITHADIRTLANAAATGQGAAATVVHPVAPELQRLATAVIDLQDARHDADYNHEYEIDKRTALSNLELAEDAVKTAQQLGTRGDASYRRFLVLLLGGTKIARQR